MRQKEKRRRRKNTLAAKAAKREADWKYAVGVPGYRFRPGDIAALKCGGDLVEIRETERPDGNGMIHINRTPGDNKTLAYVKADDLLRTGKIKLMGGLPGVSGAGGRLTINGENA